MSKINLEKLSYEAVVAIMNALNPSPGDFSYDGDKVAFTKVSLEVAKRWQKRVYLDDV